MTTLLFYCAILFIITYFSIRKFITIAPQLGLVDIPNERSSHQKPMPRGAGLVFGLIFLLGIVFYDLDTFSENKYTFLAILIIYICGVVDDKFTISAKQKLVFIVLSSVIVYFNGYEITNSKGEKSTYADALWIDTVLPISQIERYIEKSGVAEPSNISFVGDSDECGNYKVWIIAQEENNPHIIELTDRKKIDHMIILYWD